MLDPLYFLSPHSEYILLALRLLFGIIFIYFGIPKLKDLSKNADDFTNMGFKPGWLFGTGIAVLEVFGGILFILGVWVPILASLFGIQMIVGTIWKIVATTKKFPDWSYDLLLLGFSLVFLGFGAGAVSLL